MGICSRALLHVQLLWKAATQVSFFFTARSGPPSGAHRGDPVDDDGGSSGYSPRLLAAAGVLCEMASSGRAGRQTAGRVTWPIAPSQKTMKARKVNPWVAKPDPPRPPSGKAGDPVKFCAAARVGDEKKRTIYRLPPPPPPPLLRCSLPTETARHPLRAGRDSAVNPRVGVQVGPAAAAPARVERGHDGRRRHGGGAAAPPGLGKGWGKER